VNRAGRAGPCLLLTVLASVLLACRGEERPKGDLAGGHLSPLVYFHVMPHRSFFVPRDLDGERVYETRRPVARPTQRFAARKADDVLRVFILGGSVAGLYDTGAGRPRLAQALEAMAPGKRAEVLNCGLSGYDSARTLLILREVLDYDPDLLIVMSAVNEGQGPPLPAWSAGLCGLRALRRPCAAAASVRVRWSGLSPEKQGERLAGNLAAMTRAAKGKGVPIVLGTVPVCLRDMPPVGSLPTEDPRFFEGWAAFERGDYGSARKRFESFLAGGGGLPRPPAGTATAMGRFFLARSLDAAGKIDQARAEYRAAWDNWRPGPMLNEVVRTVARAEGAALADIEAVFAAVSPDGLPGRVLFEDDVHWDRRADPLATLAILRALRDHAARGSGAGRDWVFRWLEEHGPAIEKRLRAADLGGRGQWDAFRIRMWTPLEAEPPGFSERVVTLLESVRLADPPALDDPASLRSWLDESMEGSPWGEQAPENIRRWWPRMAAHAGEMLRRRGEQERALLFFEEALRLRPDLEAAALHRVLALIGAGRLETARGEIGRRPAWKTDPAARRWLDAYAPGL